MAIVAAERVLEPGRVVVRVYVPELHTPSGDWTCRISVGDHAFEAFGVDALQALLLALVALEAQVRSKHPNARFCGQAAGGLPALAWPVRA